MFKVIRNADNVIGYDVVKTFDTEQEANEFIEGGDGELSVISAQENNHNYDARVVPYYVKR
jgi:hypothetical protein